MRISVLFQDPDFPYIITVHFEEAIAPSSTEPELKSVPEPTFETSRGTITFSAQKPAHVITSPKHTERPKNKLIPIFVVAIVAELIILGVVTYPVLFKSKSTENQTTESVLNDDQIGLQAETSESAKADDPEPPQTDNQPDQDAQVSQETQPTQEIQPSPVARAPQSETAAFDELRDYVISTGLDMSFGYVNLATGYTYTYQGDRVYYGASLVKTLDAMYAYEKLGTFDWYTNSLIINAITYSKNEAHTALVERLGIDNLRKYSEELGMKHHLKPSSIYSGTYYFCDTTVDDQLIEWKHLWYLVNNLEMGWELGEHFRIGWWGVLQFPGHPDFMFKAGFYGPYYNETGIFLAEQPYIFTLLTTNGYRADRDYIMSDLSRRVYEINQST